MIEVALNRCHCHDPGLYQSNTNLSLCAEKLPSTQSVVSQP